MHKYQAAALAIYLLGRLQEDVGRLVGNKRMQSIGYGRQIAGRARKAIGEADHLIKRCRNSIPNSMQGHSTALPGALISR